MRYKREGDQQTQIDRVIKVKNEFTEQKERVCGNKVKKDADFKAHYDKALYIS